jgi:tetratricopeptide (TPR) repeat protein
MHCTSCGRTIEGAQGGGRCTTCHRLFQISGTEVTELRVEPPPGAPHAEFLASFAAGLGLSPAPTPARGMRNFEYLTMDDDATALATRAERTREYSARTFDMVRAAYTCPACNKPTPPPIPLIPTRAPYRSIAEVGAALPALVEAGARAGREVPACSCGATPVFAQADHHLFSSQTGGDLVVRVASGAAPVLLGWTLAGGYLPVAPTPELDRVVAGDAIARSLWALRDSFDEHEDMESMAMLFEEGIARAPENRDLLELCPFLMKHGGSMYVEKLADAHIQAAPGSELGHYWKAQLLLEQAARGGGDPSLSAQAKDLLERAVQIKPDYPDALIGLANIARLAKDDATAETRLKALLAAHPDHPEANYTLGLVLLPKDPAGALACFERGEKASPNDADYPRSKARALLALGRKTEARVAIQRAASLAPDDPRIAQVAAEIGGGGAASAIRWIVIGIIVVIFGGVGWFVYSLVKPVASAPPPPPAAASPTPRATTPSPANTPAPASPPAAAPAAAPAKHPTAPTAKPKH